MPSNLDAWFSEPVSLENNHSELTLIVYFILIDSKTRNSWNSPIFEWGQTCEHERWRKAQKRIGAIDQRNGTTEKRKQKNERRI